MTAKSYLEVGVYKGDTFLSVDVPLKEAVDPKFMFDVEGGAGEGETYHQVTSDKYFSDLDPEKRFDIVFLDGLHTFEQTFRDFCNTLCVTHALSLIIIDDTIPVDIYSSHSDPRMALKCRHEAGGSGQAWHGDVFKMIFAIHDFFPRLSYTTVSTMGNPQTIVWRQPRHGFEPRFNSLERISRLDWFDLKLNIDIANLVPEPQALSLIADRLAG